MRKSGLARGRSRLAHCTDIWARWAVLRQSRAADVLADPQSHLHDVWCVDAMGASTFKHRMAAQHGFRP
jgi:hypothetical protein